MEIRSTGSIPAVPTRQAGASNIIQNVELEGKPLTVCVLPTQKYNLVVVTARNGFVGCSYFDMKDINDGKENVAIVTGVNSYDDVLKAKVIKVSDLAAQLGITEEMSGREALLRLS